MSSLRCYVGYLCLLALIKGFVVEAATDSVSADDYYSSIDGSAVDDQLKGQLHDLINPHTVITYDEIWQAFPVVDQHLPGYPCSSNLSCIPDIYSSYCWNIDKVVPGGECGNYKKEGDCFNREHVWPKSWWGGFDAGQNAQTDLFELWPSDGYVNNIRGDNPIGFVDPSTVTYTSSSGAMLGTCNSSLLTTQTKCFELPLALKGDIARTYFYISTAYSGVWSCCDEVGVNASTIKPWLEADLRAWHRADPVDDTERDRNEVIYQQFQQNRNPFIDHPEWVDQISDF